MDPWVSAQRERLFRLGRPELATLSADIGARLRTSANDPIARAHLHLLRSGLRNRLRALGIDARENGLGALADAKEAVTLAPADRAVVTLWARLVLGISRLGWVKRTLAKQFAKVDVSEEARRLLPALARFDSDALATVLLHEIARSVDDRRAEVDATEALTRLPPNEVADARAQIAADSLAAEQRA